MSKQYPISICMAGAVSAGAYSAGAMSVLVEALRRLNDENLNLPHKPPYDVLIKGMSGASAGSIQAVLSSLDLFSSNPKQELGRDAWLSATIDTLLSNDDLKNSDKVQSILNSQSLKNNAKKQTTKHESIGKWPTFLANDYKLRLSITNLRGVPYCLSLPKGNKVDFGMSLHNEYMQYQFSELSQKNNTAYVINPLSLTRCNLENLITGSLASSAFPLAFSAVEITRPGTTDDNQLTQKKWLELETVESLTTESYQAKYSTKHINPKWNKEYGAINKIYSVDGGATKNEPLTEAFKILFGDKIDQWESVPDEVDGKVLFIDPFPNPLDKNINSDNLRVDKSLGTLISSLTGQARFSEKLIVSEKLQNRVGLVYPKISQSKDDTNNEKLAIKSGALGGFSGFLKKEFMLHDYQLGKLNMQRFLRYHFTIDQDHKHLNGHDDFIDYWSIDGKVPIIPIYQQNQTGEFEKFSQGETKEGKIKFYQQGLSKKEYQEKFTIKDRLRLKGQLKERFKKIIPLLLESHSGKSEDRYPDIKLGFFERFKNTKPIKWLSTFAMSAGTKRLAAGFLADTIIKTIEDNLSEQGNLAYKVNVTKKLTDPEKA